MTRAKEKIYDKPLQHYNNLPHSKGPIDNHFHHLKSYETITGLKMENRLFQPMN